MPAGKPTESSAWRIACIIFIVLTLLLITTTIIFYTKSEEHRTQKLDADRMLAQVVNPQERNQLAQLIGKTDNKSAVGSLLVNIQELAAAITGEQFENISAFEIANGVKSQINKTLENIGEDAVISNKTNSVDLLSQIDSLKSNLDISRQAEAELQGQLDDFSLQLETHVFETQEKVTKLQEETDRYQKDYETLNAQFNQLREDMIASCDERVENVQVRLDQAVTDIREKNANLDTMQASLEKTSKELQTALTQLENIKPKPAEQVAAFQPDAKIVRIDTLNEVVYLNVGKDDLVYPGLTFSVYDPSAPIPKTGEGKAEIEVFNVKDKVSAARINRSSIKNPIVPDDIVANLIWDKNNSNRFVVVGEFDFNRDGIPDSDGQKNVQNLIMRAGGRIIEEVTVETDFVILGIKPTIPPRPSPQERDMDPMLLSRYETAVQTAARYDQVFSDAATLAVPTVNLSRFLHLIGYESLAKTSSPIR